MTDGQKQKIKEYQKKYHEEEKLNNENKIENNFITF